MRLAPPDNLLAEKCPCGRRLGANRTGNYSYHPITNKYDINHCKSIFCKGEKSKKSKKSNCLLNENVNDNVNINVHINDNERASI